VKSLLSLLEPEEFVGGLWHRLTEKVTRQERFPAAATTLDEMQRPLGVLFRGLGGAPGLRIVSSAASTQMNRRTLRQRVAGADRTIVARCDGQALYLPQAIDSFPEHRDNRALYIWLAAFFVHLPARTPTAPGVVRDIAFLRDVKTATRETLATAPGLIPDHARLRAFALRARPVRRLPPAEAAVEQAVRALLDDKEEAFEYACARAIEVATKGYRPYAPVPLWGETITETASATPAPADAGADGSAEAQSEVTRKGKRSEQDQTERSDYLALNRFEKLLTMSESMNLARPVEDDDADGARKAAEDSGEIVLSPHRKHAATRLKLELDMAPAAAQDGAAQEGLRYPEWDWRRQAYRQDYCRVVTVSPPVDGAPWEPSVALSRQIRRVRRQFDALRPRHEVLRAQTDGDDLDMDALVRSRADFAAGGTPSDRIYLTTQKQTRDLAVALLVDASLSTETWIGDRRVIDVARESALLFCHALDAGGDGNAVYAFTSRGRNDVQVSALKTFEEPLSPRTAQKIGALEPGYYTRIGAAMRHVSAQLALQPARHRLLLVVTDGKPNDTDHYEGRFGVEDTRRAVLEARRKGARVFGIAIDRGAQAYFPTLFGRGGYAIVSDPARLPTAMPLLLKHIMAT
jgi:nitric oxide reductase NorD protein